MPAQIGYACKLYFNSATGVGAYATPVWAEILTTRDVTVRMERGKADASVRGGNGWKQWLTTLADASIDFQLVYDTDDPGFDAVQTAFLDNTTIDLLALDGDVTNPDQEGFRAVCNIGNFSRNEGLEEAVTVDVTGVPAYQVNPPVWFVSGP